MAIEGEKLVAQYAALLEQQTQSQADIREIITRPRYALPFLQPGRLVSVLTQPEAETAAAPAEGDSEAANDRVRTAAPIRCCRSIRALQYRGDLVPLLCTCI